VGRDATADIEFGARLKRARDDAGLSTAELAERLVFSREAIDRHMRGERRPTRDVVARWEEVCGLEAGSLVEEYDLLPPRRARRSDAARAESTAVDADAAPSPPPPRWTARRTLVALAVAATVAVAGLALAGLVTRRSGSGTPAESDCAHDAASSSANGRYCVDGTCVDGTCVLLERQAPNTRQPPVGERSEGRRLPIVCQVRGQLVVDRFGASGDIWDRLDNGRYVLDYYTTTPGQGTFSEGIPRCVP